MSTVTQLKRLIIAEFLENEQHSDIRHELVHGEPLPMVGASALHNLIATGLVRLLGTHLAGSPCRVFMSDMKVRVEDAFYYPDLLVTCEAFDPKAYYQNTPVLISEILSTTTEARDRFEKRIAYQKLASLREYLLVSQEKTQVEIYRRTHSGWEVEICSRNDTLRLQSIGLEIPIEVLYHDAMTHPDPHG